MSAIRNAEVIIGLQRERMERGEFFLALMAQAALSAQWALTEYRKVVIDQQRGLKLRDELRTCLARMTDVAENLAREVSDPGTEALAAIWCARELDRKCELSRQCPDAAAAETA